MYWSLGVGALICTLLGVFIVFTSISVKKFLTTHINGALNQQQAITFSPFECQGLFKISCSSKKLSLLDKNSSQVIDFENFILGLESLDKSSLTLSIKSQAKSPILEQLAHEKITQIPLKDLNTLFEKTKPTHLKCSLKFNAIDTKTLDSHLKCDLSNQQKILSYTFSQDTKAITQNNLSIKSILETLTSQDKGALENLKDNLHFSFYHSELSLKSNHLKKLLEPFYNQNKESLSFFSPYFSLRSHQAPNIPYDSTLLFLEEHLIALLQSDFKDNPTYFEIQKNSKDFLKALVAMAKEERSTITLSANVKDTKAFFNLREMAKMPLGQHFFKSYQFNVQ